MKRWDYNDSLQSTKVRAEGMNGVSKSLDFMEKGEQESDLLLGRNQLTFVQNLRAHRKARERYNEKDEGRRYEPINDPQLYGWTPEVFPNPLNTPIRCGIGYFRERTEETSLRLCDPDWVLGRAVLERIASRVQNFTSTFAVARSWEFGAATEKGGRHRSLSETASPLEQPDSWLMKTLFHLSPTLRTKGKAFNRQFRQQYSIELAVATVLKMNLPAVLKDGSFKRHEDEDDMVNDAAQLFASGLYESWWNSSALENKAYGILIFISIRDRVCYISTGAGIKTILPRWRLDHVVTNMKPDLQLREYGRAILRGIDDITGLLEAGPPTLVDYLDDFFGRFGVVLMFAMFTVLLGAWGEYRGKPQQLQYVESRSQLNAKEMDVALQLQGRFRTRSCPICLEEFPTESDGKGHPPEKRVDRFGVPVNGNDGLPLKILRCGHIFDSSCWRCFVHSDYGNPCICPVCRQDVGKTKALLPAQRRSLVSSLFWHQGFWDRRAASPVPIGSRDELYAQESDSLLTASMSENSLSNYSSTENHLRPDQP